MGPMASIQKRETAAKGITYQVKWRHDGKQCSATVDTMRDARMLQRWLDRFGTRPSDDADLLRAIGRQPQSTLPDVVTVQQALEDFAARPRLADSTRAIYRHHAGLFTQLHELSVLRVTPQDVTAAMEDVRSKVGPNTASNAAVTLAGALRPHGGAPLLQGWYATDSAQLRQREPYALSPEQLELLVKIGHQHGIGDLLALGAATGARFGELIALQREHAEGLEGARPQLLICQQIVAGGSRVPTTTLKTRTSKRRVPISRAMASWVAEQGPGYLCPRDRGPAGVAWNHELARWRLNEKVVPQAIAEGVIARPVKFHDLRHSFGANLLATGRVDIVAVSKWMGHANPGITGTTYGHVTELALQAVYDVLG